MKPDFIIFYISDQKQAFPFPALSWECHHCKLEQASLEDALERLDEFKEEGVELAICLFDLEANPTTSLIYEAVVNAYPKSHNLVLYSKSPWPNSLQRLNQQTLFATYPRNDVFNINLSLQQALSRFSEGQRLCQQNHDLQEQVEALQAQLSERTTELLKKNISLQNLSVTDKLTQLPNRLKLDEQFSHFLTLAERYHSEFSIILLDIDHFKQVNDVHGHQVGDKVLTELAQLLQEQAREADTVGRWGGEEFLILSPNLTKEEALLFAEKLRLAIEAYPFTALGSKTASFGVTEYLENDSQDTMIERVDKALYHAKNQGRNRVEQK